MRRLIAQVEPSPLMAGGLLGSSILLYLCDVGISIFQLVLLFSTLPFNSFYP